MGDLDEPECIARTWEARESESHAERNRHVDGRQDAQIAGRLEAQREIVDGRRIAKVPLGRCNDFVERPSS
jgi:hypothetical protein